MSEISLVQCYQLLDLPLDAAIAAVETAYANKMMRLLRQGAKTEQQQLKLAYHQLKDHLLAQGVAIAEAEATSHTPPALISQLLTPSLSAKGIHLQVMVQGDQVQVRLIGDRVPSPQLATAIAQQVRRLQLPELQTLKVYGMRGQRAIAWKKVFAIAALDSSRDDRDPFSFNNRFMNVGALPVAMGLAMLINWLGIFNLLLRPFHIWIHEFGHATVAWFAGHQATPLPFGWTNVGEDRSIIVYLCFLALLGLLGWTGWREQKRGTIALAAVLAVIQFWMTWVLPLDTYEMWLAFGGIGGELYLSTFLMVCFYLPLPDRWRWDFWRYIVLLIAASTFSETFWLWHQIKRGTESIPWGSMWGGEGDAGGDMNRLSLDYGWSDGQIIQTYSQLGNLCLLVLVGTYIFFVMKAKLKTH